MAATERYYSNPEQAEQVLSKHILTLNVEWELYMNKTPEQFINEEEAISRLELFYQKGYLVSLEPHERQKILLQGYELGKKYHSMFPTKARLAHQTGRLAACLAESNDGDLSTLVILHEAVDILELAKKLDSGFLLPSMVLAAIYLQAPGWPISVGNLESAIANLKSIESFEDPDSVYFQALYFYKNGEQDRIPLLAERMFRIPFNKEDPLRDLFYRRNMSGLLYHVPV